MPDTVPAHSKPRSTRPAHYRVNWDEQKMRTALEAISSGMTLSKAAQMYGIPKSTLFDHKIGRVLPGAKSGHPTILTEEEEEELVSFVIECCEIGYPKSRQDVIAMAQKVVTKRIFIPHDLSNGWWQGFCRRHTILTLKMATSLSISRAKASSPESLKRYYSLLEQILTKYGLTNDAALIFNMDESGFPLDPKPLKGVFVRGEKNPCSVSSGNKAQITVVGCVSAGGQCLPPMIVWPRKTMPPSLAVGEIPGSVYGLSDSGWMNQHLFCRWFKRHFLRYAPAARPLLLLLDGHSSHYCPETLKLAQEEEVIILALPPNTTHLTQPLDKGVFGPLKMKWRQVVHDFRVSHPGQVVNQYNFCRLFSKAWIEGMTAINICAGFRTTGIHPLNADILKIPCQTKTDHKFIDSDEMQPFTPAKRQVFYEDCFSSDSSFSSVSDYQQIERQNTIEMANIENVPQRKFKTKSSDWENDPENLILTSEQSVANAEAKKRVKDAREQKKVEREQKKVEREQKKLTTPKGKGIVCGYVTCTYSRN